MLFDDSLSPFPKILILTLIVISFYPHLFHCIYLQGGVALDIDIRARRRKSTLENKTRVVDPWDLELQEIP